MEAEPDPKGVLRVACCARYSACGRAGVIGGGGAISAFLSRGGRALLLVVVVFEEEVCCRPKNSPSALRCSKLEAEDGLFSSSSNSTSIRPSPSSSVSSGTAPAAENGFVGGLFCCSLKNC